MTSLEPVPVAPMPPSASPAAPLRRTRAAFVDSYLPWRDTEVSVECPQRRDDAPRDPYATWIEHQAETGAIVLTAQVVGAAFGALFFGLLGACLGAWIVGAVADFRIAQHAPHSGGPSTSRELRVLRAAFHAVPLFGPAVPLIQAAACAAPDKLPARHRSVRLMRRAA